MTPADSRPHRIGAAVLVATGAVAFWYFRIIRPAWTHPFVANLGNVDFFTQIYPMSFRAAAWIRDGVLPLWNPYQFAGHPFLATALYGVCYPPNVLYLLLPTAVAIEALVVFHMALSGWLTYRFAGEIGLAPVARLAAAAVYMFCGFMASQSGWFTPAVASSTWLPLALTAVERIVGSGRPSSAALLAAATALALLGGWTQFWLYTTYVVVLYAVARIVARAWAGATRAELARIVVLLGLGLGLGVAVTAVQLLPTRELQVLGPRRPGGLTMEQLVPFMSLPPERLMNEMLDWRTARPFVSQFYLGPIVLALVATSLAAARGRVALAVLWTVFVASLLVSIGQHTPFFEQVYLRLPAARLFRLPQRIAFLVAFSAAMLTAFGIDALGDDRPTRRVPKLALGGGMLGLGAALLWRRPPLATVELALVVLATGGIAAAVLARGARRREVFVALAVGLVVVDFWYGTTNVFRHPFHGVEILHKQDPILDYIHANQDLGRTYLHDAIGFDYSITQKQGTLREIYSIGDYEPLSLVRFAELYDAIGQSRGIAPFSGYVNLDPRSPGRDVLDVLSLRYWVERTTNRAQLAALTAPTSPWRRVADVSTSDYALYEHTAPLPRAYVATHAQQVADGAASLAAVTAPGFDPRRSVIVEREPGSAPPSGMADAPTPVTAARIVRYEPREVRIEADVTTPGYLVLTDTFYPGWRATVDDAPAPIYAANHVVRAVPVAPGHHVVAFRYAPTSVLAGAVVSLLASVAIAAVAVGGCVS